MATQPLTIKSLKQVLRQELKGFGEILRKEWRSELRDAFEHYEKRAINRENALKEEMFMGFGDIIATINDHMDERFGEVDQKFEKMQEKMDERFDDVNHQLTHLNDNIPSIKLAVANHEKRISALENSA